MIKQSVAAGIIIYYAFSVTCSSLFTEHQQGISVVDVDLPVDGYIHAIQSLIQTPSELVRLMEHHFVALIQSFFNIHF